MVFTITDGQFEYTVVAHCGRPTIIERFPVGDTDVVGLGVELDELEFLLQQEIEARAMESDLDRQSNL